MIRSVAKAGDRSCSFGGVHIRVLCLRLASRSSPWTDIQTRCDSSVCISLTVICMRHALITSITIIQRAVLRDAASCWFGRAHHQKIHCLRHALALSPLMATGTRCALSAHTFLTSLCMHQTSITLAVMIRMVALRSGGSCSSGKARLQLIPAQRPALKLSLSERGAQTYP